MRKKFNYYPDLKNQRPSKQVRGTDRLIDRCVNADLEEILKSLLNLQF